MYSVPAQDQSNVPVLDWFSFLLILVTPGGIIPPTNNTIIQIIPSVFVEQGKGLLGFQIGRCLCEHLFQKNKMLYIYR